MKALVRSLFALVLVGAMAIGIVQATMSLDRPPCKDNCPNHLVCNGTPATQECWAYCPPGQQAITCATYYNYGCAECPQ
jgi:hypothetical protein